jgi:hypothetical protein
VVSLSRQKKKSDAFSFLQPVNIILLSLLKMPILSLFGTRSESWLGCFKVQGKASCELSREAEGKSLGETYLPGWLLWQLSSSRRPGIPAGASSTG